MRETEREAWCVWHEHWVAKLTCMHCEMVYPACYAKDHLRYACAVYVGVMKQSVLPAPA